MYILLTKLYIDIHTYYQGHENGICRNGFDGFRLYHDSITSDSLKRSRWPQTVSGGLKLCIYIFYIFS